MPMLHPSIPAGPFDLAALLEYEPPVRWRPEPEDQVVGNLVKIEPRTSFKQTAVHMWLLVPPKAFDEHDHLYVTVRCAGVILSKAVGTLRPVVGEKVALRYEGMQSTADGQREYRFFRMGVRRGGRWVMTR